MVLPLILGNTRRGFRTSSRKFAPGYQEMVTLQAMMAPVAVTLSVDSCVEIEPCAIRPSGNTNGERIA